jgi:hypothetical protein
VVRAATVAIQRRCKYASTTVKVLCFLRGPCRRVIFKIIGATFQLTRAELRDIRRTVTTWVREAEESPLLKPLLGNGCWRHQAGKRLSGCCGDLWIVESSSGAIITRSYKWWISQIHQSIPRLYSQTTKIWQYQLLRGLCCLGLQCRRGIQKRS